MGFCIALTTSVEMCRLTHHLYSSLSFSLLSLSLSLSLCLALSLSLSLSLSVCLSVCRSLLPPFDLFFISSYIKENTSFSPSLSLSLSLVIPFCTDLTHHIMLSRSLSSRLSLAWSSRVVRTATRSLVGSFKCVSSRSLLRSHLPSLSPFATLRKLFHLFFF